MNKRILIVDDSFFITKLLKDILEEENFEVLIAHTGEECLNIMNSIIPDLIILDMILPKKSGRQICEEIRKNPKTKYVKIVFLTQTDFSEIGMRQLEEMKVSDYISKKFDPENIDEFIGKIKKILY